MLKYGIVPLFFWSNFVAENNQFIENEEGCMLIKDLIYKDLCTYCMCEIALSGQIDANSIPNI